jgi:hypothetical protein
MFDSARVVGFDFMALLAGNFGGSHAAAGVLFDNSGGCFAVTNYAFVIAVGQHVNLFDLRWGAGSSNRHNDQRGAQYDDDSHQTKYQGFRKPSAICLFAHIFILLTLWVIQTRLFILY